MGVPNTGGWARFAEVAKSSVNLTAGAHVLRVAFDAAASATHLVGGFDWLRISKTSTNVTLTNHAAAFVRNAAFANQNFGHSTLLELKKADTPGLTREGYLSFDLSGVASISSAVLRVFGRIEDATARNAPISVYGLLNAAATWDENQITWN